MKEWFQGLAPRERLIVMAGAGAAIVIVGWGMIWTPLSNRTSDLRETTAEKSRLLTDLHRAASLRAPGTPTRSGQTPGQSLVVLIDSTPKSPRLTAAITRTRQDGPDGISVNLQNAPFDELVAWLVGLETDDGISVESATFNASRERGLVSGQLLLRR